MSQKTDKKGIKPLWLVKVEITKYFFSLQKKRLLNTHPDSPGDTNSNSPEISGIMYT